VVDVDLGVLVPGLELLSLEPQGKLAGGRLNAVRAVDDVAEEGEAIRSETTHKKKGGGFLCRE